MKSRSILLSILVTALSIFAAEQSYAQARHEVDVDFTTSYSPIWNDNGSGANSNVSFWRPNITSGWSRVGHHISKGYGNPTGSSMLVRPRTSGAIADPIDYVLIWNDKGSGAKQDGSVWRPVCQMGYQFLGDVTSSSHAKPTTTEMVCVHESALVNANAGNPIWNDAGSDANANFGSWEINPSTGDQTSGLFFGAESHSRPKMTLWAVRSNTVQPVAQGTTPVEEQFWDSIKNINDTSNFQSYLNNFPNGKYAALARLKISQMGGSISQTPNPTPNPTPVSPTGSTSSVEEQYWDAVKNSSKVQDFQGYLDSYPSGKYVSIARLKMSQLNGVVTTPTPTPITVSPTSTVELQYWDAVKNSTNQQDFQSYLRDYPNGQFTPIARLKLQQLQGSGTPTQPTSNAEDQYWNSISNSQSAQDFQGYLNNFPNGKYAAIARLKIGQLSPIMQPIQPTQQNTAVEDQFWNNVKNSSRAQDFQSYLNTFPNGQYAGIARLRINQLISPNNPGTVNPNLPATGIPVGTNNQSRGDAILSKAQIGSMNEMLGLRKYWIITETGDLDSKTFIAEELRNEFPQLTAALAEEDAEFFILFAMVDQATGVKIIGNTSSPNQTQLGQLLVFRSLPTNSNLPNIRILFNVSKTRVFNNTNGTFSRHPATNGTRDFVKELKKIKF